MIERIAYLWPEITLFVGACVVMILGLSPNANVRRQTSIFTGLFLFIAAVLTGDWKPKGFARPVDLG